jgi:putative membrane protein
MFSKPHGKGLIMKVTTLLTVFALAMAVNVFAADEVAPKTDAEFASKIALSGKFETKAGAIAQQRSQNSEIKAFGELMVQDHTRADSELTALAAKKGWSLPSELDAKHKEKIERLNSLSGAEFDRTYTDMMAKGHSKTAVTFRRVAQGAVDADFKAWAAKTLPVIESHLGHAEKLSAKSGNTIGREPRVKASYEETKQGTPATENSTQDAQRHTDRAPNTGAQPQNNSESGTKNSTQDAQRQTDRTPRE